MNKEQHAGAKRIKRVKDAKKRGGFNMIRPLLP
jgi:hypothetical protein